ncbi:MAG: hypothetical protein Q8Q59_15845 [Luteolibacter sp.]|nr:hypothetical protein [Luteolibacter sp.]
MNVLAETMISGEWLTAFVVAVIGAIASALIAWKKGEAKGRGDKVTLQDPMPKVPVERVYSPPSFSQHMDLRRRVETLETDHQKLRREVAEQYIQLLKVGEERKDKIIDEFNRVATGFHSRVNQLVSEIHNAANSKDES